MYPLSGVCEKLPKEGVMKFSLGEECSKAKNRDLYGGHILKKDKFITLFISIISIVVICLAGVQLLGLWDNAINIYEPLIGMLLLVQSVQFWNKSRKLAICQLCAAVFVLGVAAFILLF